MLKKLVDRTTDQSKKKTPSDSVVNAPITASPTPLAQIRTRPKPETDLKL